MFYKIQSQIRILISECENMELTHFFQIALSPAVGCTQSIRCSGNSSFAWTRYFSFDDFAVETNYKKLIARNHDSPILKNKFRTKFNSRKSKDILLTFKIENQSCFLNLVNDSSNVCFRASTKVLRPWRKKNSMTFVWDADGRSTLLVIFSFSS